MSDDQDHSRRGGDAGTERALEELRVALEQLTTRMEAGLREDLAQIRAISASVAERDVTGDVQLLRADVAALVERDASAQLREDVAALRAEVARLASVDDVAAGVRSGLGPLQSVVDRISTRLDESAGDDTGADVLARLDALADRLDQLPTAQQVANLAGDLRAQLADALGTLDGDVVVHELGALRAQLGGGHGTVVEQLEDHLADVASGEVVGALWDEVRAVRTELADGLVVEPSDALAASLDALKDEVDGLRDSLGELRGAPEPADVGRDDEALLQRLDALQVGLDEVRARLDDGLVLADDVEPPGATAEGPGVEAVADQVAALRDFVASELDTIRQTVAARIDAAAEATAATVAAAAARPEPEPAPQEAPIDAAAVDLLRDEIRAAGAIPDQVIDALREELKALRRRIAVKASERVLDDQQLAQIADAVAARLAEDRGPA